MYSHGDYKQCALLPLIHKMKLRSNSHQAPGLNIEKMKEIRLGQKHLWHWEKS